MSFNRYRLLLQDKGGYRAKSPLLEHTYFTNAGALRMTTTRQFDLVNRLKQIGTVLASAATINSFAYGYNPAIISCRITARSEEGN